MQDLEGIFRGAGVGDNGQPARVVHLTGPGHEEPALLHRNPAGRLQHRARVAFAHDHLVDVGEDGVDAVQMLDAGLGGLALADVAGGCEIELAVAGLDVVGVDLDRDDLPGFGAVPGLDDHAAALFQCRPMFRPSAGVGVRIHVENGQAEQFGAGVAELATG